MKKSKVLSERNILAEAGRVLDIEKRGLESLRKALNKDFLRAVHLFFNCSGRVVVIGIGKSGLIGRKLAATLTSTGTPAVFMHPAEAFHGDLGLVGSKDVILAMSFSGESKEVRELLPYISGLNVPIVGMTGSANSRLGKASDAILSVPVEKEACPYNITPTTSTTAMLALGDALALVLMQMRGFGPQDFAKFHPGGALGRRLNLKAKDVMHQGKDNPVVKENVTVRETLFVMTQKRSGAACVVNASGKLTGYFTDGDLRRRLEMDGTGILAKPVSAVMTRKPMTVKPETSVEELIKIFKSRPFDNIPVVDAKGKPLGIVDERDLL